MSRFGTVARLRVRTPFRLDLTVDALRRLATNVVDVVGDDATFYRALRDERGATLLAIRQTRKDAIDVRATGRETERWLPTVRKMLGTGVDLRQWHARSADISWLRPLAYDLRGLKPPRYPTVWEACAHAIVFQQISIHSAAAIMRRLVLLLAEPVTAGAGIAYPFPEPRRWLAADAGALRAAGLSQNKAAHLRAAAAAFASGVQREEALAALPTPQAAEMLARIRGIGPWSAAVVLLRGLGRLDIFPARDSGVARSVAAVAGRAVDLDAALTALGPSRGMLYFHLLLSRTHGVRPPAGRNERACAER